MEKKIANIVFYKFKEKDNEDVKACLFYNDGTIENVSYEKGLKEAKLIAAEENATRKDSFTSLLNSNRIYVMSGEELTRRFNDFIVNDNVKDVIEEAISQIDYVDIDEKVYVKTNTEEIKSTNIDSIEYKIMNSRHKPSNYKPVIVPVISVKDEIEDEEIIEVKPTTKETKEEKETSRVKNFVRGKALPLAVAAILAAGISLPGFTLSKDSKEGVITNTAMAQTADDNGKDDEVVTNYANNEYYNDYTYAQLLEVTTNETQKEVMENVSVALDWYNGEFANAYVEKGKDIRPALTWDEMIALEMAYNDYSKQEIHAIFNGAEISSNDLENAYKNATLQLMGAYVIEKEGHYVDVSKFVHDPEGIAFVQKYQDLFEAAKNAEGDAKVAAVEAFYRELYKDFPITEDVRTEGISHADHRTIESYKLAVTPIVAAAEIMFQNLEIDATLTDPAIEYFNDLGLCNLAQDKFDRIETITLACCEYDMENPLYEQFKNAKIKELKAKGIYVIDDAHRDLSRLDRFQELVNWHFKMVDGHFELETWYTTETYTTYDSYTVTDTKTWTESSRTETSDRSTAVALAGEEAVSAAEARVNQEIDAENTAARIQGEAEAAQNQEELQRIADEERERLEDEVRQDDADLQQDIQDANDRIDNGQNVNESDFGDHNVNFDNSHSDSHGNLDNSVQDITTDGQGADNELPDPSKTGEEFDKKADKPIDVTDEYEVKYDPVIDKPREIYPNYESTETNVTTEDTVTTYEETSTSEVTTYDYSTDDNQSDFDLGDPNDIGDSFAYIGDDFESEYEIEYDNEIDYADNSGPTNEDLVDAYVEAQASESNENDSDKVLVKE